ncbi:hypothetical protein TEA_024612 [Camellia sinensis var. sinensis]|uniref:Disease resistance R13L4/SHOC-2-like LRR domain-containing protein n=1 Tax=Camellia sinensis var. sinensis TaxID=542762 RepID=A0A4S4DX77_CAMSN|nr:hypothetical protein TEA_024612 [Camellia sinensis var. sinensis]
MHVLFLSLSRFHLVIIMANSLSAEQPKCHADESSALLQFKQSFSIGKSTSSDPSAYPKVASWNLEGDNSSNSGLKFEKPGLRSLLHNLTNLKVLRLNDVSISSEVPDTLANLTSLTTLVLESCGLHGEFPISIFYLPNLQVLDVSSNGYLIGHLPEFHPSSPLQDLMLSGTSFSGKLPDSIGNLNFLNQLDFSSCYFSGSLPASLGNLTQLNYVSLSSNKFNVGTLQLLGKLTELTDLDLSDLNLYGSIPSVLSNLTQLSHLDLSYNHLSGEITSHITNLTHLIWLDLSSNQLRSPTPRSFSELKNLELKICYG